MEDDAERSGCVGGECSFFCCFCCCFDLEGRLRVMVGDSERACAGADRGEKLYNGAVDDGVAPGFGGRFPPCDLSLLLIVLLPI